MGLIQKASRSPNWRPSLESFTLNHRSASASGSVARPRYVPDIAMRKNGATTSNTYQSWSPTPYECVAVI